MPSRTVSESGDLRKSRENQVGDNSVCFLTASDFPNSCRKALLQLATFNLFNLFLHYLQLGRRPVAGVVTCYISTDYEDFTLKFRYGGLHEKHVVV